jgi:A/G-specific adenine glycosylase
LARFSATAGWPGNNAVLQKLWLVAESYTPDIRVADYTQAMMDMGATLCTRSAPSCYACPLSKHCKAFQQGNPKDYPGKKLRKILPIRTQFLLMIHNSQGEVLLQQNPPLGLWGGLWVFPQVDTEIGIAETCSKLGLQIVSQTINPTKRHTFSHFHLDYQSVVLKAHINSSMVAENGNHIWYNTAKPLSLGMPAPIKALLDQYYPNQ